MRATRAHLSTERERRGAAVATRRWASRLVATAAALCAGAATIPAAASADPVLAAAGDIACQSGETVSATTCQTPSTARLLANSPHDAVAALGDQQYEDGTLAQYTDPGAYDATWGIFNPIVHPVPGNHDYHVSSSAAGYFSYFGQRGVGVGSPNGYYSYDLGAWHIVALNSNCGDSGCQYLPDGGTTSTAQDNWLKSDLAAHQGQCILAYWHHPRFTSGMAVDSPGVGPLWTALYAAHADVVVNAHDHLYERFAQQDPSGTATAQGIREFVAGTGGKSLFTQTRAEPNLQATDVGFGVLFLTLHPSSYDWAFRAADGSGTVVDSGSAPCNPHPLSPGATTGSANAVSQHGATVTGSLNPRGSATTYAFQYGTTPFYGAQTPVQQGGSGSAVVAASAIVGGLAPGKTYHYRLVATNGGGSTTGADATFTTLPARFPVKGLTAAVTPHHARTKPFRFTFSGKLTPPRGITAKSGCKGAVAIQIKSGKRTVLNRRAGIIARKCTYQLKVVLGSAHLKSHGKLTVSTVFLGNAILAPKTHRPFSILYG